MQSEWDGAAYERVSDPQVRWAQPVLDRLVLSGDERVLDIGCGTGRVTEQLAHRLPRGSVVGLDASALMIKEARKRFSGTGGRVELVIADAGSGPGLPVEPPVDAVFSTAAFHWIPDHDRLFKNIAAVLRPGGQLEAQCGGVGNLDRVRKAVSNLGETEDGVYYATPEETLGRLLSAGFCDCAVWLQPEPTKFDRPEQLWTFLEVVVLRNHLERLPESQRPGFLRRVVEQLEDLVVDFVRLNISAWRQDGLLGDVASCRW